MNGPLFPAPARLVARQDMTADTALFTVVVDQPGAGLPHGGHHRPGQFVMLSVPGVGEAPFSICQGDGESPLVLCIRRVGRVTERLFELPMGAVVGLRGPYGNGFDLERARERDYLLIAGGLGMAPIRGVLRAALARRGWFRRLILVHGGRDWLGLLFKDEMVALSREGSGVELVVALDHPDGQEPLPVVHGHCGVAVDALVLDPALTTVAVCGPPVMYRPVVKQLRQRGVYPQNLFLTFERRMECGIGHCGHCAIGYRYTCLDGPVFSAWEARGLREAWE
ncbi:MAG: FAD/NAD(P)-binding protein [Magnetococcus sp. WYHC-3]